MKLSKNELKSIKRYFPSFSVDKLIKPNSNDRIHSIIMCNNGYKNMHDSGYPTIKCIGVSWDLKNMKRGETKFFDLGSNHDHFLINIKCNIDCLGKEVFHIMFRKDDVKCVDNFVSFSSLMVDDDGVLS